MKLTVQALNVSIGDRQLCRKLDFRLAQGESLAVLGRNGAGKSTLLLTLAGLRPIEHGDILLDGQPLRSIEPLTLAKLRGYCPQQQHDAFATSPVGRVFPVRPEWLVEAIGLVYLDPQAPHVGPIRRPDGRLEIHTPVSTAAGQNTKVLVLDGRSGLIYEQHLLDERGQRIASASGARHFRDPLTGLVLPRETTLTWTAMALSLKVELNEVQVNPLQISAEQWTKPQYPGYPETDVTSLTGLAPPPIGTMPPGAIPPTATPHSANARYAPPVLQPLWPLKR